MCQLSWNLAASTSWKPKGLSRPVMWLLCFLWQMFCWRFSLGFLHCVGIVWPNILEERTASIFGVIELIQVDAEVVGWREVCLSNLASNMYRSLKKGVGRYVSQWQLKIPKTVLLRAIASGRCKNSVLLWGIQWPLLDSSWNVMAHGDIREGKWRGNWLMEWVSQYPSHYLRTWCIQH